MGKRFVTAAERQMMVDLHDRGLAPKAIAAKLDYSEQTVCAHLKRAGTFKDGRFLERRRRTLFNTLKGVK